VLLGLAAVLAVIAIAAFHGSAQTPGSSCSQAAGLLRRTTADASIARRSDSAAGRVPAGALVALRRDGDDLTTLLQGQQSSDVGFDERALPVTDAITALRTDPTAGDLGRLTAAVGALDGYCGVPA
jgi:hypothetical protein